MLLLVASILGHEVTPQQPLMEAGLDSLGVVELKNALSNRFMTELPTMLILDHPTPLAIANLLSGGACIKSSILAHRFTLMYEFESCMYATNLNDGQEWVTKCICTAVILFATTIIPMLLNMQCIVLSK